jgi:hypothetical protein
MIPSLQAALDIRKPRQGGRQGGPHGKTTVLKYHSKWRHASMFDSLRKYALRQRSRRPDAPPADVKEMRQVARLAMSSNQAF